MTMMGIGILSQKKKTEFDAWLEIVYSGDIDNEGYDQPEWAKPIDGPQSLLIHTFSYACN
jgi:hypothetical protein